jgi:hypothetical protein
MTRPGGPEVKYAPVEPVLTDIRKELFGEGQPRDSGKPKFAPKLRKKPQSKAHKNKIVEEHVARAREAKHMRAVMGA